MLRLADMVDAGLDPSSFLLHFVLVIVSRVADIGNCLPMLLYDANYHKQSRALPLLAMQGVLPCVC